CGDMRACAPYEWYIYSSMERSNVVVFAGAGASKAVNASEYPTTIEFFERLPHAISNHTVFGLATEYLSTNLSKEAPPDIEQVLWVLQELDAFMKVTSDPDAVAGWFLRGERLLRVLGITGNYGHLIDNTPKIREIVAALISQINAQVYDFYQRQPKV